MTSAFRASRSSRWRVTALVNLASPGRCSARPLAGVFAFAARAARARLDPVRRPTDIDSMAQIEPVHVVGGGLAGSEAAWQIAESGVPVVLHEMRPVRGTDAHQTDRLAELVCSNSFRS